MGDASTPVPTGLRSWRARVAGVAALAVVCGLLTLLPGAAPTASAAGLVPWADCDELVEHYRRGLSRSASPYGLGGGGYHEESSGAAVLAGSAESADSSAPVASSADGATGGAVGTGPTGTNVQESGVDEPDTVKLAGDLLVAAAGGRLQVLQADASPTLLASLPLGAASAFEAHMAPAELLVDGSRVLVVTSAWRPDPARQPDGPGSATIFPADTVRMDAPTVPVPDGQPLVRLLLVDLAEPRTPRVLETLELDGGYVSARLVQGTVRLVTTSRPQVSGVAPAEPYGPAQERAALERNRQAATRTTLEQVLPTAVRRGGDGTELSRGPAVDCTSVRHAASTPAGVSTLLVTTLRPAQGLAAVDRTAVTTDGDLVYASASRLYVATSRWGTVAPAADGIVAPLPEDVTTHVHAFDTSQPERTPYVGSGVVPGYVYGRWALSEHEGHLRVATTSQPPWDGSGGPSSSSVVVLAEQGDRLVERGRLDGLGLDERIYAVRYFGDIATVVTFRQTDPLYVLDLSDPARPRQLGELKIPGFSTYLHPVGDDRLLGVGQDADASGRVVGFQLSLFDLTDLSAPTQVDRLSLGEGYSPASDDSRAFAYDPARRLALLPFTSWQPNTGQSASSALAVRVTEDFQLAEAGRLSVGGNDQVERVLTSGDVTYAVTLRGVVAADSTSLTRTGSAAFAGA